MVKQVICLKMHPKPNQKLFFFIQATLLSIYFPGFFCGKYITYPALNTNCSGEPFQCGSIRYISYPFWGGSRPLSCGRQGFELICQGNVPMLNMSSLSYRVQEIDFSTNTLKVAREDLWNYTCPKVLHNTTIDLDLFKYLPKSNDENVTLYFDCTDDQETLPNQFSCDVNGVATINLFKTGDASSGPGSDITCNNNISVPVNQVAAQSLQNPTASSINVLQAALASGFSIQWLEDEKQYSAPFCNRNVYASCISSSNHLNRRPVYRSDPITVPAAAPEERQGPPPVQSPGSAAKGEGINTQTGNGMPPVQSPGYPPESVGYYRRTGNGKYRAKKIAIVVTLSITVMIVVSISIRCCLKRQHWPSGPNQVGNQDVEKFLLQQGSLAPKRYKYSEIKKITKSFNDKLGQGGYGSVYKGVLPDGCLIAVKVLIETDSNGEEFINEVASISRTSHINIVNLLGFCYEGNQRALVYEFMPNKSLDKFISNSGSANTDCHLDLEKLYKIAVGVAKGLEYLHTGCNTRIVHFDIKPQNILLDEDFCPKISDFGLAKLCKKKQSILSLLGTRGTIGYIAPEMFSRNFGGVSHKSDVYSYGMMVLEMAGARKIVETEAIQSSENYFPDKIYEQVILDVTTKLDSFRIEEEEENARRMFLVGFWCIQTTPSDRPSMSKVVEMLEGSLQSIPIPPKPVLFTPTLPGQVISSSFSAYVETEHSAEGIIDT